MQSLIDGFAAARNFWNGAPFFLVTRPAAVAVSSSDEHQLAQNTAIQDLPRLAKGPVVPVIEAYPHQRSRAAHRLENRIEFPRIARAGLFNQNMLARGNGRLGDLGKLVMSCGDKDDVDVRTGHRFAPILRSPGVPVSRS